MGSSRKSSQQPWVSILLVTALSLVRHASAMPAALEARQTSNITLTNTTSPAINTTATALTSHEELTGWMAGPATRGTLNIIFTCVITLFLCIWTTVQVNIEPPQDNVNNTLFKFIPLLENKWLGKLMAGRLVRKMGWSCVTIIVPEATLAIAAYERRSAYLLRKAIKDHEGKDWDLTLCYYAVMGGFVIDDQVDAASAPGTAPASVHEAASLVDSGKPEIAPQKEEVTKRPETKEGKPMVKTSRVDRAIARVRDGDNQRRTLTPQGVYLVWKTSTLPDIATRLPIITAEEVKDKNKASKLTKGIVFFQALWMIVQVISRAAGGLPVTLIELHTCLHTFCALAMYATWWEKPVDVDLPTTVIIRDSVLLAKLTSGSDYIEVEEDTPKMADVKKATSPLGKHSAGIRYLTSRAGLGKLLYIDLFGDDLFTTKSYFETLGNGYGRLWSSRKKLWREAVAISFVGLIYGGLHLAAWRNQFPTEVEQMLWRVAAAITAIGWSGFVCSLWLGRRPFFRYICGVLFGICLIPCLFVRVYLFLESFISLRKLEKKAYDINVWSQLWPHAG